MSDKISEKQLIANRDEFSAITIEERDAVLLALYEPMQRPADLAA